ncbi:MAG TPA: hypothetical protein PKL78_03755 [Anaerolineales bacterium]|nr:hypothetical protein [Anaerolineales bacterium]
MLKVLLILFLFFQDPAVTVTFPQTGDVLRGTIEIQGRMDAPNFASAELAFAFASDSGGNWFTLQTFSQPVTDPILATWDTTSITDGDYTLRLRVSLQDGTFQDALVTGLKIRNDEPLPTPTSTATEVVFNFQPLNQTPLPDSVAFTPTSVVTFPTSTSLPANPASLTVDSIVKTFWQSAVIILALFAFLSLILRLRKN